jgi:hypothetical protein
MCPLQSASKSSKKQEQEAGLWRSRVCQSCCDRVVSCSGQELLPPYPLGSRDVGRSRSRSFAWPMTRHTALPLASALRRVVRARPGGLLSVTAPTPQYHNLERWPAAALSLNYPEGAAMLPSEAAMPGLRSQARSRSTLYYWTGL